MWPHTFLTSLEFKDEWSPFILSYTLNWIRKRRMLGTPCDRYELCREENYLCSYWELYPTSLVVHPAALSQYSYSFIQHSRYPQVDTELVIIITMCTVQNES